MAAGGRHLRGAAGLLLNMHLLVRMHGAQGFCVGAPASRCGTVRTARHVVAHAARRQRRGLTSFTNVTSMPPLAPALPPLAITYTNEGVAVQEWLQRHVGSDCAFLGFDTESVPTVRSASLRYKGPVTLQLASAAGACLVVHLAHVPLQNCFVDKSGAVADVVPGGGEKQSGYVNRFRGMDELAAVLADTRILKAGVGVDLDCIEMWRAHRLAVAGRLELGGIGAPPRRRLGLQKLSEMVPARLVYMCIRMYGVYVHSHARAPYPPGVAHVNVHVCMHLLFTLV
jgi:hypothetical protein